MFTTKIHHTTVKIQRIITAILIAALALTPFVGTNVADAAALNQTFVRFDRMQTSQATTGTICFKPATASASSSVAVTFPTSYALGAAATFTVNSTNLSWPTGGTAITGITTASGVASQTVTFPYTSATLSTSTLYCFNWINSAAVTQPGSASSSETGTVTLSNGDTASYATSTVTSDNVQVTATVPQVFSLSLDQTLDALGTLSTGSVKNSTTATHASVSTNAKNGWIVWAKDAFTGLCSPTVLGSACTPFSSTGQIGSTSPGNASPLTLTAGTTGYNLGVTAGTATAGATATIDSAFTGSANTGGGLDNTLRRIGYANSPSAAALMNLTNNVSISAIVPAASDYQDYVYVVGAGMF